MELINRSKLGLVFLSLCCISLIWFSVPKGIASLYKLGIDNQFERTDEIDIQGLDELAEKLYQLDSSDPSNLLVIGYNKIHHGFSGGSRSREHFEQAKKLTLEAIKLRPLDHVSYARLAYIEAYLNEDFSKVRIALNKAKQVGPYESYTASAGIDIYFSHWTELTNQEKIDAVTYITQHGRYGLNLREIGLLVARSPLASTLCQVSKVKALHLRSCR